MKKHLIEVPINVRYISEWEDFDNSILQGHSIINKTITGCGFTHYTLTNNIPTILCSPRKFLLENKYEQLPHTYLVVNDGEKSLGIDSLDSLSKKPVSENDYLILSSLKESLQNYILQC